jgi:glycosyltransferase involved in cell wall biosynthesis
VRVLVVHNRYRSSVPSGENQVVDAEIALLQGAGVQVATYFEHSDELVAGGSRLGKATAAVGPVYSPRGMYRFRRLLADVRPDVVHVHNVFPLISPWIVRESKTTGIPVVQTVHNYRHSCLNGLHVRDGHRCDDCVGRRLPWPGVVHACYRDSRLQSVPMALSQALHKPTWRMVDAFLALSPFMVKRLVLAGLPEQSIVLRPSWVPDRSAMPVTGHDFCFVGRLDEPKGIPLLLKAWRQAPAPGRRLRMAGDGPLREQVQAAADGDHSLEYVGRLDAQGVISLLEASAVLVLPSVFYEGFPLVLAEAFAAGRPAVVTAGGSVASLVTANEGWEAPLDAVGIANTLAEVTDADAARRGRAARQRYERELSPRAALSSLLDVYTSVVRATRIS